MNEGKLMDNRDKGSLFLLRFNITGFTALLSTILLYDILLQYGTHSEVIATGISIGLVMAISLQLSLHKLMTMRKKNNDRRLVDDTPRRISDRY